MRRLILASLALISFVGGAVAADMAVKARPMVVDPQYNWSGFYIGGTVGGVWTEANRFMPDLPLIGASTMRAHFKAPYAGKSKRLRWG